ncbi:MAG: isopeptide-forming domain-containing fimbrial protein [Lactobacillales bacterium]|jgi:fimbrial isopeptide formation D2 family protein/LPXTG-motif cell wall-anchored protein|nr:isopeptide-forming domain-containing fimbrial protein [Lactobacillales bacterium]
MTFKKKLTTIAASTLLFAPAMLQTGLPIATSIVAYAEDLENTVTNEYTFFDIKKLDIGGEYPGSVISEQQNTGMSMVTEDDETFKDIPGLAGVKFTAYDVSARYYYLREHGLEEGISPELDAVYTEEDPMTAQQAYTQLNFEYGGTTTPGQLKEVDAGATAKEATKVGNESDETDENGNVQISLLTKASGHVGAAYVIYETTTPTGNKTVTKAVPMVVVTPVFETNDVGERIGTTVLGVDDDNGVKLYPKNETKVFTKSLVKVGNVSVYEEETNSGTEDTITGATASNSTIPTGYSNGLQTGDIATYTINIPLPSDLAEILGGEQATYKYSDLTISDTLPVGLTFNRIVSVTATEGVGAVTAGDNLAGAAITGKGEVAIAGLSFTLSGTGEAAFADGEDFQLKTTLSTVDGNTTTALQNLAGKYITVTVEATMDKAAKPNVDMVNTATFTSGGQGSYKLNMTDDAAPVRTFGFDIVKRDKDSGDILAGVKFALSSTNVSDSSLITTFAKDADGVYYPTSVGGSTDLITDAKGHIAIKGLQTGTYTLTETATLQNYVLPTGSDATTGITIVDPRTATPINNTYATTTNFTDLSNSTNTFGSLAYASGLTFTVYTSEQTNGTVLSATNTDADYQAFNDIGNYHKGTLPSTGSKGIILFIAIGAAVMGLFTWLWKRNNKEDDELEA